MKRNVVSYDFKCYSYKVKLTKNYEYSFSRFKASIGWIRIRDFGLDPDALKSQTGPPRSFKHTLRLRDDVDSVLHDRYAGGRHGRGLPREQEDDPNIPREKQARNVSSSARSAGIIAR